MPRLVRKHRKRHSLFRLGTKSELVRESHANAKRCKPLGNHLNQSAILRATAGENDFVKSVLLMGAPFRRNFGRSEDFPDHEALDGIANGPSRERGSSSHNVLLASSTAGA